MHRVYECFFTRLHFSINERGSRNDIYYKVNFFENFANYRIYFRRKFTQIRPIYSRMFSKTSSKSFLKFFPVKSIITIVLHRNFSCTLSHCYAPTIDRHYVPSLPPVKCFRKTKQLFAFWLNERTRIENFPLGFKLFVV